MKIGMSRYLQKLVCDDDIEMFAQISNDHNPVQPDDVYANDAIFAGHSAHGMLTAELLSAVSGENLSVHGTVYKGQTLRFLALVRPGGMVRAKVTVIDMNIDKRQVELDFCSRVDAKKNW